VSVAEQSDCKTWRKLKTLHLNVIDLTKKIPR